MVSKVLAKVFRGDVVESVHSGHFVILGPEGEIASAGSPKTVTFIRSAAKPFQALPCIISGAADAAGFSDEEIALACASHSGEPRHVRIAQLMLERIGLSEIHLRCGSHLPFNEKEAERMMRTGEFPTQLHNNCSGKHAAMLAFAKHIEADITTYDAIGNPVQDEILNTFAAFTETPVAKIKTAIDGCAAPNFALPLSAMARGFMNLISPPDHFSPEKRSAAARIVSAMAKFPELIGGTERLDTMLMQAAEGQIISKVGAEGVWLCGVLPGERFPGGLAIALKIDDGDDRRARPVAAVAILKQLRILGHDALPELSPMPIRNRRGDMAGHVEASIDRMFA
ncbi:MAG: asparaginase [Pyrinomonadaceae bacterium]|nr:asparaginase [Pyrinomonadaceae bacterium]